MLSAILVVAITKYYRNAYQAGQNTKADQNWPITVPFTQPTVTPVTQTRNMAARVRTRRWLYREENLDLTLWRPN